MAVAPDRRDVIEFVPQEPFPDDGPDDGHGIIGVIGFSLLALGICALYVLMR